MVLSCSSVDSFSSLRATYNAMKHKTTGLFPHFLLPGCDPLIPTNLLSGCSLVELRHNTVLDLQERMRLVHELIKEWLDHKRNLMIKMPFYIIKVLKILYC